MGIPDRASSDLEFPEQRLLRDGDRLQEYASAFLRGEITAEQYSALTLAEINRRAPIDPLLPLGDGDDDDGPDVPPPAVVRVVHEDLPMAPTVTRAHTPQLADRDRSLVLARAFATGRIRGADFLRLIRDC